MEQLLDTAVSMIGSPIQLYDPSLKLIASSSMDSDDMLYQEFRENHGLNRKTAEYLSEINFFPPDDVNPSPILLYEDSPISPYVQLFYRVDVAGRIKAIVYVVFSGKAYSPIAVRLMHLLVEKVGIAVEQNDILDSYNSLSYSYLIQDLLSEKKISPEEIESRAAMVSLPYQASFYVLSFPTASYQASPPLEFFLWECEASCPMSGYCVRTRRSSSCCISARTERRRKSSSGIIWGVGAADEKARSDGGAQPEIHAAVRFEGVL